MHLTKMVSRTGLAQGTWRFFYENGKVKAEVPFVNGKLETMCSAGSIILRMRMTNSLYLKEGVPRFIYSVRKNE